MIHYHGTPCGGFDDEAPLFLKGRHALVSWVEPRHLNIVAEVCQSFCLDNGAFTFWRKKKLVDWNEYYQWVALWMHHPGFDFAFIPDVIDGDEAINDRLLSEWPFGHFGVPVWHMHESLARLNRLASNHPKIAIGSSGEYRTPGSKVWWLRMITAINSICVNGRPVCKIHGLRMLAPKIFTKLPLASADSANAARNSGSLERFGIYKPPKRSTRMVVIAERIEALNSSPTMFAGKCRCGQRAEYYVDEGSLCEPCLFRLSA